MKIQTQNQQALALLRIRTVLMRIGISKSQLYALIKAGKFPAPIKLGERISLWRSEDIDSYIQDLGKGGAV